jgi:hypothetical protein
MLPCPMETRATASAASRVLAYNSDPAHQRAGWRVCAPSTRRAPRKRKWGERNDAPFWKRNRGCSDGDAPKCSLLERHGGECCESEGTVSVSMCHVRGQFLTNADLFDPRDHLTFHITALAQLRFQGTDARQSLKLALSSAPVAVPPNPAVEPLSRASFLSNESKVIDN